jgi:hypothetical protein
MKVLFSTGRVLSRLALFVSVAAVGLSTLPTAFADGMDEPRVKRKVRPAPAAAPVVVDPPPALPPEPEPVVYREPVPAVEEDCGCTPNARVSAGVPIWFFNEENNLAGAAAALDVWCDEAPINLRVGVEGRHMYLGQDAARFAQEFDGKTPRITFIRIPFAAEYMFKAGESTTAYLGGGPDIIHTANDVSETSVGMHLSGRLHYAITKEVGVSLEAGYMWGRIDGEGEDIKLDNAFVTPMLGYQF